MTESQQMTDTGIKAQYSALMQEQQTGFGATLFNTKAGPGGLAANSVLLENLQNDNIKVIGNLMEQQTAAISQGDAATASKIADLMVQQQTLTMQNKQDVVQNMIAASGAINSAQQTQVQQQQLQENMQNDIAQMAQKYGVTVKPGWSLEDVANAVAPKASAQFALSLGQMQASITSNNATAALARAQASVIAPQTPEDMGQLFRAINAAPDGSQEQKDLSAQLSALFQANPTNSVTYSKIINDNKDKVWDLNPTSNGGMTDDMLNVFANTTSAQAAGLSVQDAITQYVTNNPYVSPQSKAQMSEMFYAAYGITPQPNNPWSQTFQTIGSSVTQSIINAGQFSVGTMTPYAKYTSEVGAYNLSHNQPWNNDVAGANSYVNALVGNKNLSYNQWIKQSGVTNYTGQ